jgi:hypothetical protein
LIRENNFEISSFDEKKLNGIYNNGFKDSIPKNLWGILKSSYTYKVDTLDLENKNVKLTLLNSENLNVQLLNNDGKIAEEINLKGRIKNNFFTIKRNLILYPFVPVYYVQKERKTIIGNDLDGNLVLVTGRVSEAMILMMAGGNRSVQNNKFRRIKN